MSDDLISSDEQRNRLAFIRMSAKLGMLNETLIKATDALADIAMLMKKQNDELHAIARQIEHSKGKGK